MKTIEELHLETPLSLTSVDNPIFEVSKTIVVPLKRDTDQEGYQLLQVLQGSRLRLIEPGCGLGEVDSQYRWGKWGVVRIDNQFVNYIGGGAIGIATDGYEVED